MKDFRNLSVWNKAHQVTLEVYRLTKSFPKDERFGLISQVCRCSVSIPSNIAEGCGRKGDKEFARFVQIAMGSASELEYQLLLSRDLKYLNENNYEDIANKVVDIKRMLAGLLNKLSADR